MTTTEAPARLIRAAGYCRISSDPKDKREGVERQREDVAILCEAKDWTLVEIYEDNDRSASNGKGRPAWERLLADIEAGKIDAVAAWDQDRVNRTMEDFVAYKRIFVQRGTLLATSDNGDIDLTTPGGILTASIKTAMSAHDVAMMRGRQRRAAKGRAATGRPKWRRAFGYLPYEGRKEDDKGERHPDPVTAPLVERAYKALIAGTSISDIARSLNAAGVHGLNGKPWEVTTLSLFLRSPRNAGIRTHTHVEFDRATGKDVEVVDTIGAGTWTPLVNESTWRAAQSVLNAPGRSPGRKTVRRHLLTGVLKCGKCGHHLAGMHTATKTIAYRCKSSLGNNGCGGVGVAAHHIEPLLYQVVGGRLAMDDAADILASETLDEEEAESIRTELLELSNALLEIGVERGRRELTGPQAKIATAIVMADIAKLKSREQDSELLEVFSGIRLGTEEAVEDVKSLTPERFRAVVDVLMAPVILPTGKGGHVFNEERFQPNWKR